MKTYFLITLILFFSNLASADSVLAPVSWNSNKGTLIVSGIEAGKIFSSLNAAIVIDELYQNSPTALANTIKQIKSNEFATCSGLFKAEVIGGDVVKNVLINGTAVCEIIAPEGSIY